MHFMPESPFSKLPRTATCIQEAFRGRSSEPCCKQLERPWPHLSESFGLPFKDPSVIPVFLYHVVGRCEAF